MIENKLLKMATERMDNLTVEDVRIGLSYTGVLNSEGGLGLSYTFRERIGCGCNQLNKIGDLKGLKLKEVANFFSENSAILPTSVGLAAINSVSSLSEANYKKGDVFNFLGIEKNDWVGMIGYFSPLVKKVKSITPHLFIIKSDEEYRKPDSIKILTELLGSCKIIIITATTLINKTFADVLEKTQNAQKRILVGPTTPLYPEAFKNTGINLLSGMAIRKEDGKKVLDIISQGGGTLHFKDYADKFNIII